MRISEVHVYQENLDLLFALWAWTNDIDGDFQILGAEGKSQFNEPAAL